MRVARATKRGKDAWGIVLIVVVLAVLGAGAYAALKLRPPTLDPVSLCRTDAPAPASVIILADATDAMLARHKKRLRAAAENELTRLPQYARLSVLTLDAAAPREPRVLFSKCDPGRGRDINPLFANPKSADARREEAFLSPLRAALAQSGAMRPAEASPLVDGVWAAMTDPELNTPAGERRFILVSDLLQHVGGGFSLYAPDANFETFRKGAGGAAPTPDLAGADVRVIVLDRPPHEALQRAAQDQFWGPYFEEAGAATVTFVD